MSGIRFSSYLIRLAQLFHRTAERLRRKAYDHAVRSRRL